MTQYTLARLRPEYLKLWKTVKVTRPQQARAAANRILRGKNAYKHVEALTGVKWTVVGLMHYRESNCDFTRWLHNGDRMRDRAGNPIKTVHVPKNRPPDPSVDWFDGAVDALVNCEHLDRIKDWGPEHVAYSGEKFNGFGYRNPRRNIPSPYLWGGTNHQKRGKFTSDGHYDPNAWDTQVGVMAVLSALIELDPEADFYGPKIEKPVEIDKLVHEGSPEIESVASPKAHDEPESVAKQRLPKSKTMWGGFMQYITTGGAALLAFVQGMPPWLIATILGVGLAGFALVVWGRVDVQKLVEHLSPDDTPETEDL